MVRNFAPSERAARSTSCRVRRRTGKGSIVSYSGKERGYRQSVEHDQQKMTGTAWNRYGLPLSTGPPQRGFLARFQGLQSTPDQLLTQSAMARFGAFGSEIAVMG
jgi:hypothetical protein